MSEPKLFMLLLGCRPAGRFTEQHDVFFGIANSLKELVPAIKNSWPEAKGNVHLDAWREVTTVDGYRIDIALKDNLMPVKSAQPKLFFINLGGYKEGEFDEFHYRMVIVANDPSTAIQNAKQGLFYKEAGFKGARSHIDDKFGVDTDDLFPIEDILHPDFTTRYAIEIYPDHQGKDVVHLGYLPLWKIP